MIAQRAVKSFTALAPQSITSATSINGTAIAAGAQVEKLCFVLAAAITAGSIAILRVEGSNDGSTWTEIPAEARQGSYPSLSASGVAHLVCTVTHAQMRCVVQTTGGAPNIVACVTAVGDALATA